MVTEAPSILAEVTAWYSCLMSLGSKLFFSWDFTAILITSWNTGCLASPLRARPLQIPLYFRYDDIMSSAMQMPCTSSRKRLIAKDHDYMSSALFSTPQWSHYMLAEEWGMERMGMNLSQQIFRRAMGFMVSQPKQRCRRPTQICSPQKMHFQCCVPRLQSTRLTKQDCKSMMNYRPLAFSIPTPVRHPACVIG